MDKQLPTVGAAMRVEMLAQHRDWLIAGQRDLELQDPISTELLDGDWRGRARQARELLDGYTGRLGIHAPFKDLPLLGRDPKIRSIVSERLLTALAFAAEVGATHMVLHSPFELFGHILMHNARGFGRAEKIAMVHTTLADVFPTAQQAGCMLVFENIFDTNPEPLLDLVRSFQSEYVRMSLDTGHAMITHRLGGPTPDAWVREAGALLGHVHLQDSDGFWDRHWLPGDGNLNWVALFQALGMLEQQPRLLIEIHKQTEIQRAAHRLIERGLAR